MFVPISFSTSSIFGVTTDAIGNRSSIMNSIASSANNAVPLDEVITGSTTGRILRSRMILQTVSTVSHVPNMPVLTPILGVLSKAAVI